MRKSTLAALAATVLLCACGPRPTTDCMDEGEIGTIETISKFNDAGSYGGQTHKVMLRFKMRRFERKRGAIRICQGDDDQAISMLKVGDTLRPRNLTDKTP